MMTEVYMVRHCETVSNNKGTLAGWIDTDISEKGARQLEELSKRFEDIRLDALYSTHLKRAVLTAEAINSGSHIPIMTNDKFLEIGLGSYEDVPVVDLPREEIEHWVDTPHLFGSPDGERMTDVMARGYEGLMEVVSENRGKVIGIATHGGCIKATMTKVYGYPPDRMDLVPWTFNTSVTHLFYDDDVDRWIVDYYNDDSHLTNGLKSGKVEDWAKKFDNVK